jgi:hypothetical protein
MRGRQEGSNLTSAEVEVREAGEQERPLEGGEPGEAG